MLTELIGQLDDGTAIEACKGVYFRYTENNHVARKGMKFVFQKQISFLKRRSCPGCSSCDPLIDDAMQGMQELGEDVFEFSPDLKHNDVVQIVFVPGARDWETGYLDTWHYRVVKA